jgi:hypothetical protein
MARDKTKAQPVDTPVLRNPELEAALQQAVEGDTKLLMRFLLQGTNLRSQPPGAAFGRAFGDAVTAYGEDADPLVEELLATPESDVGGEKSQAHLQALMAHVLAARIVVARRARAEWAILMRLAEDYRKPVRDGVVAALTRVAMEGPAGMDGLLAEFQGWTDGFLQACVALEMLTQKTVLPHLAFEGAFQERLQECLTLALDAPRSASRSQGRRTLLMVLAQTLPTLVQRFPELLELLAPQVQNKDPAVQEMWSTVRQGMEKLGMTGHDLDTLGGAAPGKTQRRGGRR